MFFSSHLTAAATSGPRVNLPPIFTQDMNNLALSETTPVNTIVYRLEGYDPEGESVTFGMIGTDFFDVDELSGDVKLVKQLDREVKRKR